MVFSPKGCFAPSLRKSAEWLARRIAVGAVCFARSLHHSATPLVLIVYAGFCKGPLPSGFIILTFTTYFRNNASVKSFTMMPQLSIRNTNSKASMLLEGAVGVVLSLFMIRIFWSAIKTLYDLKEHFSGDIHGALKLITWSTPLHTALLEVLRTCLIYFSRAGSRLPTLLIRCSWSP